MHVKKKKQKKKKRKGSDTASGKQEQGQLLCDNGTGCTGNETSFPFSVFPLFSQHTKNKCNINLPSLHN